MRATPSGGKQTRMRRDEDDILNLPSTVPWLTIASRFINFFVLTNARITRISKWITMKVRLQIQIATDDSDDFAKSRPRVWKNPDHLLYSKIVKRENHNCDVNIFLVVAILSKLNRVVIWNIKENWRSKVILVYLLIKLMGNSFGNKQLKTTWNIKISLMSL